MVCAMNFCMKKEEFNINFIENADEYFPFLNKIPLKVHQFVLFMLI